MRSTLAFAVVALVLAASAAGSTPGARILFLQPLANGTDVVETDADATGYLNLTPGQETPYASDQDGSWSPDGSQVVFTSHRDSNVSTEIYVMDADGSDQRRLTHDGPEGVQNVGGQPFDFSPVWSPDGGSIAYLKGVGQADDVWMMRPDGGDQRRVTVDGGVKRGLQWSSRDRLLYENGGTIYDLVEGRPPVSVAHGLGAVWSPDGRRIAFTDETGLWTIGPDGQDPVHVATMPAAQPSWSPTGGRIAFVGTRTFPELTSRFGPAMRQDLYTVRLDGSDLRRLTGPVDDRYSGLPTGSSPIWWPDGSRLFFLSQRSDTSTTYQMNSDGSCEGPFAPPTSRLLVPVWQPGSQPGLGPIGCVDLRLVFDAGAAAVGGPAGLGQPTELRFILDNDGSETATGVRVQIASPAPQARIESENGSSAVCTGTGQVLVCTLPALPPGRPVAIAFGLSSPSAGSYPLTATASAIEQDSDPTTNSVQTGFQVLPCTRVGTYGDDVLYGTPGPDKICGLTGADHIYGGAGNDYIDSGNGADIVVGGPGRDTIVTKGGNDLVYARDGQRDVIDCGTERDVAVVDRLDVVSHCETVVRPKRRPTAAPAATRR